MVVSWAWAIDVSSRVKEEPAKDRAPHRSTDRPNHNVTEGRVACNTINLPSPAAVMHSRLFLNNNNNPKVVASLYAAAVCTRQPFAESRVLSLFTARVMCYYPLHHHHHHHHRCQVVVLLPVDNPCHPPLLPGWRKNVRPGIFQEEKVRNDDKVVWCADTTTTNTQQPKTCHLSSPPTSTNCSQAKQKWGKRNFQLDVSFFSFE